MDRIVNWDSLDLRLSGEKLSAFVRQAAVVPPLEELRLTFTNGCLLIEGRIRKFIAVPFSAQIRGFDASGRTVRFSLQNAAAFGGIPIPQFLFRLVKGQLPAGLVSFEEPATFVVTLDRFLPPFLDAEVANIWIIDGGLAVTLGRGGADLPPSTGGSNG